MRRAFVLIVAALVSSPSFGQLLNDEPGWRSRASDGLHWKDYLGTTYFTACNDKPRDTNHLRRSNELPRRFSQAEQELLSCYEVRVRNTMNRPLQCRAVAEQKVVPKGAGPRIEGDRVIYPRFMDSVIIFFGDAKEPPRSFDTVCVVIPDAPPPYEEPARKCRVDLTMPVANDFLPEIALRLKEHGDVLLEYGVNPGSDRLNDVRIVGKSNSAYLDSAALAVAHESRVRGGCAQTRYRQAVSFVEQAPAPGSQMPATAIVDVTDRDAHENGEARWLVLTVLGPSNVCGLTGADRKYELGAGASPQPRANARDCVANSRSIRNTSAKPIYCRAVVKLDAPDESGRREIRSEMLVLPDATEIVATAYTETVRDPASVDTQCEIRDVVVPPAPKCEMKIIKAPKPDDFYPPESRRAFDQGDVILEFRVDPEASKLREVWVATGSGYKELDLAALDLAKHIVATTNCARERKRIKVKFRVAVEPAPAAN